MKDSDDQPVLLFDVMSTIVYDPFAIEVPAHFGVGLDELLAGKDLRAWPEFERDEITEDEFFERFFADRRLIDGPGMKDAMRQAYRYLDGMPELLDSLSSRGYAMHTLSNYPHWWQMIEDKLELSQFLEWTFVSCKTGVRKPDAEAYLVAARTLGVDPSRCIFVDDRGSNCKAAVEVGMRALKFTGSARLITDLREYGIEI